jgi:hypothetical protein
VADIRGSGELAKERTPILAASAGRVQVRSYRSDDQIYQIVSGAIRLSFLAATQAEISMKGEIFLLDEGISSRGFLPEFILSLSKGSK